MSRALAGLLLVAVAILGVIYLGAATRPQGPATGSGVAGQVQPGAVEAPARGGAATTVLAVAKVVLECEAPTALEDGTSAGVVAMRRGKISLGEELGYLEIPDGWIKEAGLEQVKETNTGGALPGKAVYEFSAPRAGTYYLFLRAQWLDSCGDSVFLRVNDRGYETMEDTEGRVSDREYRWAWHPLREKGENKGLLLEAGQHRLELATREDGPKFDKILLSTDPTQPGRDAVDP
jgi:hypothetical protein